MGARFSQMQNGDRRVLAEELYTILKKILGGLIPPDHTEQSGLRASFILTHVYSSTSHGSYNNDVLFVRNPTLDGLGDVVLFISDEEYERLISLFGQEIVDQIKLGVLRLWMTYLLNNILTDEDATDQRVEECRMMLAREIVRRVCDGATATEQS